jgi:hypothetical protein
LRIGRSTTRVIGAHGTGPKASFHFVEGKQMLAGYRTTVKPNQPDLTTPEHIKGIAGTYRQEFRQLFVGQMSQVMPLAARQLQVELGPQGVPVPKMTPGWKALRLREWRAAAADDDHDRAIQDGRGKPARRAVVLELDGIPSGDKRHSGVGARPGQFRKHDLGCPLQMASPLAVC